ncbi:unnamed protein product [Trifolium pratense]|uniref:Uncharacterized protein n=1 Tax=Trifolium pratense TaxID=57577 RepID=A0ACB0K713_TRIPR|nr:unnamed protein product [Trifolium pratense]
MLVIRISYRSPCFVNANVVRQRSVLSSKWYVISAWFASIIEQLFHMHPLLSELSCFSIKPKNDSFASIIKQLFHLYPNLQVC